MVTGYRPSRVELGSWFKQIPDNLAGLNLCDEATVRPKNSREARVWSWYESPNSGDVSKLRVEGVVPGVLWLAMHVCGIARSTPPSP